MCNLFANIFCMPLILGAFLISLTCFSVNFDQGHSSPFNLLARPLEYMSSTLSWQLPNQRCLGLQHKPLSQVCNTHNLSGIGPMYNSYAIREEVYVLPFNLNFPLPVLETPPVQFKQPLLSGTLFVNYLSAKAGEACTALTKYAKDLYTLPI